MHATSIQVLLHSQNSNRLSLVSTSGDAMRCGSKFHQGVQPESQIRARARASGRTEETYFGALDAKKEQSTAIYQG
jgi:hypothetical protein